MNSKGVRPSAALSYKDKKAIFTTKHSINVPATKCFTRISGKLILVALGMKQVDNPLVTFLTDKLYYIWSQNPDLNHHSEESWPLGGFPDLSRFTDPERPSNVRKDAVPLLQTHTVKRTLQSFVRVRASNTVTCKGLCSRCS